MQILLCTVTERAKPMREIRPVVPCYLYLQLPHPFGIQLALFLSFSLSLFLSFSLSLFLSFSFSLSLSLSFLWQVSFEQCHTLEGLFSYNLAITICCTRSPGPSHRAIYITLERNEQTWMQHERKMHANERKMKRTWMHIGINMKGIWKEHEWTWTQMKGTWKDNERKWLHNERKMHANERNMKEDAYKWMQNEGNMKCCRSTWNQQNKQLLDPFPSLFRNGFWLHVGSRICWFPQNPGKR